MEKSKEQRDEELMENLAKLKKLRETVFEGEDEDDNNFSMIDILEDNLNNFISEFQED